MKKFIPWLIALAITAVIGLTLFGSYVSAYNYGNTTEQNLISIRENNQNIYAQGTQRVMEVAQVPGMYAEDLGKLVKADIEGRYGADGSRATMQWIKERNLNLPETMYVKIQQEISGFRRDFEMNQKKMIDVKRSYNTSLNSLWTGFWMKIAGYPKINLDDFKPIITSRTESVYKAGKEDGPLKLR